MYQLIIFFILLSLTISYIIHHYVNPYTIVKNSCKGRICPKCNSINPTIRIFEGEFTYIEKCRHIIKTKRILGFIKIHKYCNFIGLFGTKLCKKPDITWKFK